MTQSIMNGADAKMSLFSVAAKNRMTAAQTGRKFESYLDTGSVRQSADGESGREAREVVRGQKDGGQSRQEPEQVIESRKADGQIPAEASRKAEGRLNTAEPEEMMPAEEEVPEETIETLVTAILGFLSVMAEDVLTVATEDVQEWMSVNDMSLADMLDPQNLRQMVMDLNGLTDVSGFLTDGTALEQWNQIQNMLTEFLQSEEAVLTAMENWQDNAEGLEKAAGLFEAVQTGEQLIMREESGHMMVQESPEQPAEDADEQDVVLLQPTDGQQMTADGQDAEAASEFQTESRSNGELTAGRREARDVREDAQLTGSFMNRMNEAVGQAVEVLDPDAGVRQTGSILNQVVSEIRVSMSQEITNMDFMLNPESLGRVHVSVAARGGVMTAQITVQNQEAREALESQLIILKQTFEEQGLKVESVEVNVSEFAFGEESQAGSSHAEDDSDSGRRNRRSFRFEDSLGVEETDAGQEDLVTEMRDITGAQVDYSA